MNHCMLDLESWGTRPGCALRSIGAVFFDPLKGENAEQPSFYRNIDNNWPAKLHCDIKTVQWWSEQSSEAHAAFKHPEPVPLFEAICAFYEWFREYGGKYIWSHGAAFDVPVLEMAAHAVGHPVPWNYRDVRDTRTVYWLAGLDPAKDVPQIGVKHNARDDARHQVLCVVEAMKRISVPLWA